MEIFNQTQSLNQKELKTLGWSYGLNTTNLGNTNINDDDIDSNVSPSKVLSVEL